MAISSRRSATTKAQPTKVFQDIITWMNNWNVEENYGLHGPMQVVYSERK